VVECEDGYVVVPNYNSAKAFDRKGREIKSFEGATSHFENFIHAVRSRRESDLNASIVEGHHSTALCHIANISYRLGHGSPPQEMRERIQADKKDLPTLERMTAHLAANGVDLGATSATMGAVVVANPLNEKFIQDKKAIRKPLFVGVNEIDEGLDVVAMA
jgi:hypothetical protein